MRNILQRNLLSALVFFLIGVLVLGPVGPAVAFAQAGPVPSLGCLGSCPVSEAPPPSPCNLHHAQAVSHWEGIFGFGHHNFGFGFFEFFFFLLFLLFGMMGGSTGGTPAPIPAPAPEPQPSPVAGTPDMPCDPGVSPIAMEPSPVDAAPSLPDEPMPSDSVIPSSIPVPSSSTPAPSTAPVPPVSAAPPDEIGNNWAGYAYDIPSGTTTAIVSASWNVSKVTCSQQGNGNGAPWIGFGGLKETTHNIAQLGFMFDCGTGTLEYQPWTEALPANPVYYPNDPLKAGDKLSAKVTFSGNGQFVATMKNETQGWTISTPMSFPGFTPMTGEYILEEQEEGGLPKYDPPITFSKSMYSFNGGPEKQLVTASGLFRTDLGTEQGVQQTQTSPLVGDTFSISWVHY